VIRLRGTQEEMGVQHARALLQHGGFEGAVEYYPQLPERLLRLEDAKGPAVWARKLGKPVLQAMLRRLEAKRPPAYRARTRAFMETLGLPRHYARYNGVMDVFQNVVGFASRLGLGPFTRAEAQAVAPACSTLCAWGASTADGHLRQARNFDFPGVGVWDRAPVVVLCEPDEGLRYGFVTTRGADTPGVTAFNEAGLCLTMHTRLHRDVCFSGASVVDLGHDIVRRAASLADAVAVARERRVASTWGICVSSGRERRAVVIETTSRRAAVVEPRPGEDFLACTNRYHHPDTRPGEAVPAPAWTASCAGRELRLEQAARGGDLTPADLGRLLGDHADPFEPARERATGGVIGQPISVASVVLEPEDRSVLVSTGSSPTGWGPYVRVAWDWQGEVGAWEALGDACPVRVQTPDDAGETRTRFATGEAGRAYAHFREAVQRFESKHDWAGALAHLERAAALDAEEPSYRFLAGTLRLHAGELHQALAHFEAALEEETSSFRQGQCLLWASRTAELAGARERARALRETLMASTDPLLQQHRAAARREQQHPYPKSRLKSLVPSMVLADAW
jgi:hypothetical protein